MPDFPAGVLDILVLLKLLPTKVSFKESVRAFVQFEKSGAVAKNAEVTGKAKRLEKIHPHIIACGAIESDITHYFIEVEEHRMNVRNHKNTK